MLVLGFHFWKIWLQKRQWKKNEQIKITLTIITTSTVKVIQNTEIYNFSIFLQLFQIFHLFLPCAVFLAIDLDLEQILGLWEGVALFLKLSKFFSRRADLAFCRAKNLLNSLDFSSLPSPLERLALDGLLFLNSKNEKNEKKSILWKIMRIKKCVVKKKFQNIFYYTLKKWTCLRVFF